MLLLATQVNRPFIDQERGLLHELKGQFEVAAAFTKQSERVRAADEIPGGIRRALAALRSGRPRPVQVEIPRDVQLETMDWSSEEDALQAVPRDRTCAPEEAIAAAARALHQAERPLIIAGGGVISSEASDVLLRLAECLGAPVLTTGNGVGSIPGDHPLACGIAWAPSADIRPLVGAADALLAVGTRFNEAMTHGWGLPLPPTTIRIDVDPAEIKRNLPMQHKLVGDARATLTALDERLAAWGENRRAQMPTTLAHERERLRAAQERRAGTTLTWMHALRSCLPAETVISADMSLFWADILSLFPLYTPRTMLFPWGYGTLGFALPAALGAKAALPERPVIGIAGDGAFLFTGAELATAVQYGLNIPILVFDNRSYGMIKVQQRDQYDGQFAAVDLHSPDFVQLAIAFGAYGERATTPESLGAAVTKALTADRPTLIEVPWSWTWGNDTPDRE